MKRITGLWPQITSFDNLWLAYRKARKGKSNRAAVAQFALDLEQNLLQLHTELRDRSYLPGRFHLFNIYDRKPRAIAAAPFRDRVVHHALMNYVEPLLDGRFIHDSYACRKGRGVHAAVKRYQRWAQRYCYVLKADVQAYFPSIDHARLKSKLERWIKDDGVLWLFNQIIDSAPDSNKSIQVFPGDDLVDLMQRPRGLPIGNLTSQFLGNLYLNDLDHYLQQACGAKAYLRYVDDLILMHDSKQLLWEQVAQMQAFLEQERLLLHPNKISLSQVVEGVDVLGYRVFPGHIRLRHDNGYRYCRRLRTLARRYHRGAIELTDVSSSVAAWVGHAQHADSKALCKAVLSSVVFTRGPFCNEDQARGSRRRLEQQTAEPAFGQPQQEHHR